MEAFGADLEVIPSPSGITPDLIPKLRARAAELAQSFGAYQTDQFNNRDMVDGLRADGSRDRGGAARGRRVLRLRRDLGLLSRVSPDRYGRRGPASIWRSWNRPSRRCSPATPPGLTGSRVGVLVLCRPN